MSFKWQFCHLSFNRWKKWEIIIFPFHATTTKIKRQQKWKQWTFIKLIVWKIGCTAATKHYAFVDSTILFVFLFNNTMHNDVMAHNHVAVCLWNERTWDQTFELIKLKWCWNWVQIRLLFFFVTLVLCVLLCAYVRVWVVWL